MSMLWLRRFFLGLIVATVFSFAAPISGHFQAVTVAETQPAAKRYMAADPPHQAPAASPANTPPQNTMVSGFVRVSRKP